MTDTAGPLLATARLTCLFGGLAAVDGLDVAIGTGQTVALIGPNGAGKTTVFNLLSGLIPATAGTISFRGQDITRLPPYARARLGIARTFQITNVFQMLDVRENVALAALGALKTGPSPLAPVSDRAEVARRVEHALRLTQLLPLMEFAVRELSHGDQRRVEIAMALAGNPRLLLLDEPTQGMSATETWATVDLLKSLRASLPDLTILIVEHDVPVVLDVADRVLVLHLGRLIADGSPDEIAASPEVQAAYLGSAYARR